MLLFFGAFVAFILGVAILIFVLRLFSSTLIHIPGFDRFFEYVILLVPYLVFYAAYCYLYQNIKLSKNKASKIIAWVFLLTGLVICTAALALATLVYAHVQTDSLRLYNQYSQYPLIIQLILVLITSGITASGDKKEKDWMQREPLKVEE